MSVALIWVRAVLRRQGRGVVALGVIAGLGLGVVLVAVQGARRADTAYGRLSERTRAFHALTDATDLDDAEIAALAELPEVVSAARFTYTPVSPAPLEPGVDAGAFVGLDDAFLTTVYRPLVVTGRLAHGADEVVVNEPLAAAAGLQPGDRATLRSGFEEPVALGEVTVVGVVRGLFDVGANAGNAAMLLSRDFLVAHEDDLVLGTEPALLVRLRNGEVAIPALQAAAERIAGHELLFMAASEADGGVGRALDVQALAFGLMALVAGLATSLTAVQGLARQLTVALADLPALVAIGVRPRDRLAFGAGLAAPVATIAIAVGAVTGILGSALVPTGLARTVEPSSGVQIDLVVLGLGVLAATVVLLFGGMILAWRNRTAPTWPRVRPSRTSALVRRLPISARLGAELALAPARAPAGAAARSALVAASVATTAVLGVAIFGSSLNRLLDPDHVDLAGWSFDLAVSDLSEDDIASFRARVDASADGIVPAEAIGVARIVQVSIAGTVVESYAFEPDGGAVHPTMRSGRPPLADGEIALGFDIARQVGVSVGDTVEAAGEDGAARLAVVGIAAYPELGNNSDIGTAASLTSHDATRLGAVDRGRVAMLRVPPDERDAAMAALSEVGEVVPPFLPPRLRQLEEIGSIPQLLALLLALLGAAALGHGLVRATTDRRRDLAVLRCLGFRPRDVRATVLWQGASSALIGGVLGLVGGLVVGPLAWTAVVDGVAAVPQTAVPLWVAAALVPVALAVGCALALGPGWRASHQPAAAGLAPE